MKYKGDVPKSKQIVMNEFPAKCGLPGDTVFWKIGEFTFHKGVIQEVGSANPELIINGPDSKGAGKITFYENQREDCKNFLNAPHRTFPLKLQKSMWIVIKLQLNDAPVHLTLYTYDILRLKKEEKLFVVPK